MCISGRHPAVVNIRGEQRIGQFHRILIREIIIEAPMQIPVQPVQVIAPMQIPSFQQRKIEEPVQVLAAGIPAGIEPERVSGLAVRFVCIPVQLVVLVRRNPDIDRARDAGMNDRVDERHAGHPFPDDAGQDAVIIGRWRNRFVGDMLHEPVQPALASQPVAPCRHKLRQKGVPLRRRRGKLPVGIQQPRSGRG